VQISRHGQAKPLKPTLVVGTRGQFHATAQLPSRTRAYPADFTVPFHPFKETPMRFALVFISIAVAAPIASAQSPPVSSPGCAVTVNCLDELVRMSECQLLSLYRQAEPGPMPSGYTPGRMISKPGSRLTVCKANLTSKTVWQGKNFDNNGIMTNRMFGVRCIKGEVQMGESWLDGRPSIIIDYGPTSLVWRQYRDEIREVSPGIYLGIMFKRDCPCPTIRTWFALDARCGRCEVCAGK